MSEHPQDPIDKIAEKLAETGLLDVADKDSLSEDDQTTMSHFKVISQVAQIHQHLTHQVPHEKKTQTNNELFSWGHLSVISKIGVGAFGEVFQAHDGILERDVALKLLKSESDLALKSKNFIEEARRLAKVRHPNVLAIHGADVHDGQAGFWADLIKGRSMNHVRAKTTLSFEELFSISQQIAEGLNAIHQAGIIHGDIKPANIMQDERGNYLIMDFGAGLSEDQLDQLAGYIHGTPALMAPELFDQRHEGKATDIYAFGATLFKLASNQYPVNGNDLIKIQESHQKGHYSDLKKLCPKLPRELAELIQSMINADASKRPSAKAIIRKLYKIETAPQRRRNKIAVIAVISLLVIGTAISTLGFYQANRAKNDAILAQNKAETLNEFLQEILEASSSLGGGRNVRVADVLDQASQKLLEHPPENKSISIEMHQSLAESYNALRVNERNILHAKKGLELAKSMYLPGDERLVKSQLNLIFALEINGKHQASIDMANQVINQAKEKLGEDHWYIQLARKYKVTNLLALSKYDDANAILEQYFDEIPDPETASNNFGFEILHARTNVLYVKGKYEEAAKSAEKSIAWLEKYPKGSLSNEESSKTALGLIQLELGMVEQGVSTFTEVLKLNEKIYGVDNQNYLGALVNLGAAQRLLNKPELAKQTTLQAYELAKQLYGDEKNTEVISIGANLANMMVDMGDIKQGESVMRESLDLAYKFLGDKNPLALTLEYNLAELLNNQKKYHESLEWSISSHTKKIETFGPNHPYVYLSLDNWAISLSGMEQHQKAIAKHQLAADGIQATLGSKHPYSLLIRQHQIDTLMAANLDQQVKTLLPSLTRDLVEILGEKDEATVHYQSILNTYQQ